MELGYKLYALHFSGLTNLLYRPFLLGNFDVRDVVCPQCFQGKCGMDVVTKRIPVTATHDTHYPADPYFLHLLSLSDGIPL